MVGICVSFYFKMNSCFTFKKKSVNSIYLYIRSCIYECLYYYNNYNNTYIYLIYITMKINLKVKLKKAPVKYINYSILNTTKKNFG